MTPVPALLLYVVGGRAREFLPVIWRVVMPVPVHEIRFPTASVYVCTAEFAVDWQRVNLLHLACTSG